MDKKYLGGRKMREKKLYVTGRDTDTDGVHGSIGPRYACWPMTAEQAKQEVHVWCNNAIIYRLAPVSPEEL